ncbi:unnamed protein product [Pedinophyceae sp. YPF-701]|nr:unnamed protein product [Pedinophyceae sp. YPF-701]
MRVLTPDAGAEACVEGVFPSGAPGCPISSSEVVDGGIAHRWTGGRASSTCRRAWVAEPDNLGWRGWRHTAQPPHLVHPATLEQVNRSTSGPVAVPLPWMFQPSDAIYQKEEAFTGIQEPSADWRLVNVSWHSLLAQYQRTNEDLGAELTYHSLTTHTAPTSTYDTLVYLGRTRFEVPPGGVPASLRMAFVCEDRCTVYVNGEIAASKWDTDGPDPIGDAFARRRKDLWIDLGSDHAGETDSLMGQTWGWGGGGFYRRNVPLKEGINTIDVARESMDGTRHRLDYALYPPDAASAFLSSIRPCEDPNPAYPEFLDQAAPVTAWDGDTLVVGEPTDDGLGADAGKVTVVQYNAASEAWEVAANLTSPDSVAGSRLGADVAAGAGWVAAGAPGHFSGQGAVFVFRAGPYRQVGVLQRETTATSDMGFGSAVAMSSDAETLVVSAPTPGAIYFFARSAGEPAFSLGSRVTPTALATDYSGVLGSVPGSLALDAQWGLAAAGTVERHADGNDYEYVLVFRFEDALGFGSPSSGDHPYEWAHTWTLNVGSVLGLRGCWDSLQLSARQLAMGCSGGSDRPGLGNGFWKDEGTVATVKIAHDGRGTQTGDYYRADPSSPGSSSVMHLQDITGHASPDGNMYGASVALADSAATLYVLSPGSGLQVFENAKRPEAPDVDHMWEIKTSVPAEALGGYDVDYSPRSLAVGPAGQIAVATAEGVRVLQFVCKEAGRACPAALRSACPAGTSRCVMSRTPRRAACPATPRRRAPTPTWSRPRRGTSERPPSRSTAGSFTRRRPWTTASTESWIATPASSRHSASNSKERSRVGSRCWGTWRTYRWRTTTPSALGA